MLPQFLERLALQLLADGAAVGGEAVAQPLGDVGLFGRRQNFPSKLRPQIGDTVDIPGADQPQVFGSVASRLEPLIPSLPSILRCTKIEGFRTMR